MTDRGTVQSSVSTTVSDVHMYVLTTQQTRHDLHVACQCRPDQQLWQHFSQTLSAFNAVTPARQVRQRTDAVAGYDVVDRERNEALRRPMSHHVLLRSQAWRRVVPCRLTVSVIHLGPHCSVDHHVHWLTSVDDSDLGSQIQRQRAQHFWWHNRPNSNSVKFIRRYLQCQPEWRWWTRRLWWWHHNSLTMNIAHIHCEVGGDTCRHKWRM